MSGRHTLELFERCIDLERVGQVARSLIIQVIQREAANRGTTKASAATDGLAQKQVHLAVGHTLELLERCIDLERIRKVASSLSTNLVVTEAANTGNTITAADGCAQKQAQIGRATHLSSSRAP